jgi:ABC-2 type transport system ATP-binding protein
VLEHASFHPGRTGRNHLHVLAAAGDHPSARVGEVLDEVGLVHAADRRVKGYSMGMRQRLAIASALLGDPAVLILDEPTNGLDPPGIRWVRELVRGQAAKGRAVLISSHMLAEVAQSVDDVVVIAGGRLRGAGPLDAVLGGGTTETFVRSAGAPQLASLLADRHIGIAEAGADELIVAGVTPTEVGLLAAEHRVPLIELRPHHTSLEDAFLALTGDPT